MMANRSYWTKRRLAEREWQNQQFKDDDKFAKKVQGLYENTIRNINREIDRQIGWLADRNGSSYAEMLRAVDNYDIQEGEELAKKLVVQANAKREAGQKVHYGDFTKEQNAHLRLYNATMRINRLEYLKSMVGLECLDLTDELNSSLGVKLTDSAQAEFKRQAGIMGKQLGTAKLWTSYDTQEVVMTSVAGGTWSERLWRDQDVLKAKLDEVISTGIVSGDNPRKIARSLKDNVRATVDNQRAVTERLARTETARVQYQAQLESIKGNGFKWVEWFAEPGACRICQSIANKDNGKGAGIYQIQYVPAIPDNTHPNCRCSIGSYYSDEMLDDKLKELGFDGKKRASKENASGFDINSINNVRSFNKALHENLGIKEVKNMAGVDPKYLKYIYSGIEKSIKAHPEINGYIDRVAGMNRSTSNVMASAGYHFEKVASGNYKKEVVLKINKAMFSMYEDMDHMVEDMVKNNWQTSKSSYEGIINHEMGHIVAQRGLDQLLGLDPKKEYTYDEASTFASSFKANAFETPIIKQTFDEAGLDLTKENLEKYISRYGATNNAEAFAELYSNEDTSNKLKKIFDKALGLMSKTIYRKG